MVPPLPLPTTLTITITSSSNSSSAIGKSVSQQQLVIQHCATCSRVFQKIEIARLQASSLLASELKAFQCIQQTMLPLSPESVT
ncbi:hypothetical protein M0804_000370 [Polistes exclamans]|nr:hypothetical protein M0804_000370 [Polistes exclamans]